MSNTNLNILKPPHSTEKLKAAVTVLTILTTLFLCSCGGDNNEKIALSQKRLKIIYQALKIFQSENYFGHVPNNLQELNHYEIEIFIPDTNSDENNSQAASSFNSTKQTYSLIPDKRVFLKSGLGSEKESEIIQKNKELQIDYELLPKYRRFLPPRTIIAWDKPTNYTKGGNILFADGKTEFLDISADDYQRFITALKTGTDRKFVRDTCIRKNLNCSLNLLSENKLP